jgi:hypothetical protein
MSDTACMGDTLFLVLTPNKPIPPNHGVHWYFNGNPLTTNDTAVALNTGTYTVNVENTYCPGSVIYSGDHTFTFVHCTPGINEIDVSELIDVYPNPVNTNFSVDVKPALLNRKFEIVDVLGREFQRGEFEKNKTTFDCTNMNSGFYFLRIPELNFTKKIIVQ